MRSALLLLFKRVPATAETSIRYSNLCVDRQGKMAGFSPTEAYLLIYNSVCASGWYYALFKICGGLLEGGGVRDAVEASHDVVVFLQLLSTLEIVHGCVGLVSNLLLQPDIA